MKSILQSIVIHSFALWATSQIITGLIIKGGYQTLLYGGVVLTIMHMVVKPILSVLTLPLTLLTMGLFAWVINVALVYLLTVILPDISIVSYQFPGFSLQWLSLSKATLSPLWTTVLVAFVLSFTVQITQWFFKK